MIDEQAPIESAPLALSPVQVESPTPGEAPGAPEVEVGESDPSRSPTTGWRPWTAPVALVGGIVLAAVGGLVVDLPALAFGVKLTSSHTPPGLTIADTVVQDVAFVLAAVYCAQLGAQRVRSWQFGLRRPGVGWASAAGFIVLLTVVVILIGAIWSQVFSPEKETLLKQLGSNEGTLLLVLSAALTCVVAPVCEEFLFRGYVFTALRNWKGTIPAALMTGVLFGGVHAGSAPLLDLAPLAGLGFGLCLLYRYTGSLYPCIVAHLLNNTLAFASLENWNLFSWRTGLLGVASLAAVGALVALFTRLGLIAPTTRVLAAEA